MADKAPNYKLEIRRLHWEISKQQQMREACLVQIWEAIERASRAKENLEAHDRAITDFREKLTGLETTHGTVSEGETLAKAEQLTHENT